MGFFSDITSRRQFLRRIQMLMQCEIVERIQQAIDSLPGQVLKNIVEETLKLLDFW